MKKRLLALLLCVSCTLAFAACGSAAGTGESTDVQSAESGQSADVGQTGEGTVYKIGICNYVDDASLNQIVENIEAQLAALESEYNVTFEISYDNCNADANVLSQIVANFVADEVDLMIGVATPVAMTMQAATEGTDIPVVFAAVSDPLSTGLVESLENPGSNVTGTSDALDTEAILNLMLLADPDLETVGLLYDVGQDASTTAIAEALTWDGVYYVKVWLNEGVLNVGESIMYVLIGADIRPRCIDALQKLVGKIKNDLVVEKEVYA